MHRSALILATLVLPLRRPAPTRACGRTTISRRTRSRRPTASGPTRRGSTTCGCRRCGSRAAARAPSSRRPAWCRPTTTARARCIQQLSTPANDYVAKGFYAREGKDEVKCPDVEINQLVDISDVTDRVTQGDRRQGRAGLRRGAQGRAGGDRQGVLRRRRRRSAATWSSSTMAASTISTSTAAIRTCGWCSRRRRRSRSSAAIPTTSNSRATISMSAICGSISDGSPLDSSANFLRYAAADAQPGDLTFISGHPGSTHRLDTVAELEFRRDVTLPRRIFLNVGAARHAHRVLHQRAPSRRASHAACCSASRTG